MHQSYTGHSYDGKPTDPLGVEPAQMGAGSDPGAALPVHHDSGAGNGALIESHGGAALVSWDNLSSLMGLVPLFVAGEGGRTRLGVYSDVKQMMLQVPLGSAGEARAALAPGAGSLRMPNQDLMAVLRDAARVVPRLEALDMLGPGIHLLDQVVVVVTGGRVLAQRHNERWMENRGPIIGQKVALVGGRDWLPWTVDALNRPGLSLKNLLTILRFGLDQCWGFANPTAGPVLTSICPVVLLLMELWEQLFQGQVIGDSHSGKSKLLDRISSLAPNHFRTTDITVAGLRGLLSQSTLWLAFDEAESDGGSDITRVVEALRAGTQAGHSVVRGRPDGSYAEQMLRTSVLFCAITPIPQRTQDWNRFILFQVDHEPGKADPEVLFKAFLSTSTGLSMTEFAQALFVAVMDSVEAIRDAYATLKTNPPAPLAALEYRLQQTLLPFLAVAEAAGQPTNDIAEAVVDEMLEQAEMAWASSPEQQLRRCVLHGMLPAQAWIPGQDGVSRPALVRTTCLAQIKFNMERNVSAQDISEAGIKLRLEENGTHVWVNWVTAKQTILRNTRFERTPDVTLASIAKNMTGYVNAGRERIGSKQLRGSWFFVSREEIAGIE